MKKYISPFVMFLNGTITLSSSQLGELGVDVSVISSWNDFWDSIKDDMPDTEQARNFNVNDTSTWYNGFNLADDSTWFNLLY